MMKNCVNKSYYYYYYYYSYTLTSINCHFLNLIENYKLISFLIFPTLLVYRQRRSRARRRHGEVDLIRVEEVGSGERVLALGRVPEDPKSSNVCSRSSYLVSLIFLFPKFINESFTHPTRLSITI